MESAHTSKITIHSVLDAISQDQEFDRKSIIWDGENMQTVYDELDSKGILDGRYGEFRLVHMETQLGFTLICPDTGNNSKLFETDKYLLINNLTVT
jgi:hypothetical protein